MLKEKILEKRLQRAKDYVINKQIIPRRPQDAPALLSFAQQRLWFLEQLDPGTAAYVVPRAIRFKGNLDVSALDRALNAIIQRHEVLRSSFRMVEGQPIQEIAVGQKLSLETTDLKSIPKPDRESHLRRLAVEEARRPFNLEQGPMMRTALVRLSDDEHVLLITLHHVVSDGWSTGVLLRELVSLYKTYSAGANSTLPELPIQYADFAYWQRQWLRGEVLEEQLRYWKTQLADLPTSPDIPTDRPRIANRAFGAGNQHLKLPPQTTSAFTALGRSEEATLFMTLLAAFKVLLYRYTGQEDIVIGTAIANRGRVEIEGLIGYFINSLVLRTNLTGETSFRGLLRQVKDTALEAYAHQDLPFEKLVEELKPERSLNHNPLFQVACVLQNAPRDEMELPGLTISLSEIVSETLYYDMFLYGAESKQGLYLGLQYSTDLFDSPTITSFLERFGLIIDGIIEEPDRPISELSMVTEKERRQILNEWGDAQEYSPHHCIHQLFEAQVDRIPGATALSFNGERVTYAQLNAMSNRIAQSIIRLEASPGRPLAVMLDTGVQQIAAILGGLKSGRPFVCLDPKYPAARINRILQDADPSCLISDSLCMSAHLGVVRQFMEAGAEKVIISLSDRKAEGAGIDLATCYLDLVEEQSSNNPNLVIDPSDSAYLAYTSGSSGSPKGIVQSHAAFCQFIEWQSRQFKIGDKGRVAQWASISYDASYCEIFGALCFGATLCLADRATRHDPNALAAWLRNERITLLQVVPSFCNQLLQGLDSVVAGNGANPLPDLKWMLLAGEALTVDLVAKWTALFPRGPKLFNLYGPTESVLATYYEVGEADLNRRSIPIGVAIDGRQILILDKNKQLCPIGIRGEIYIRSGYLTSGYYGQAELTQKAFVQNPLHEEYPDPVYRTGDQGRFLADGNLEFCGRVDNQVKIRGMRVELEEIESALSRHSAVSECAVIDQDYGDGDQRLIAYVVRDPRYVDSNEQASETALGVQHVSEYQNIYDEVYSLSDSFSDNDPGISLRVWVSSYTDQPFPEEEIVECVNDTVERILTLKPESALEIACGTGLILLRVGPHCSRYCGTDISEVGVQYLQQELNKLDPPIPGVKLLRKAAHEVGDISGEKYQAVIINDVIPYFPDLEYLDDVIGNAIKLIDPPGFIFLGGVRILTLLKAFHTGVQLAKSPAYIDKEQLRRRIRGGGFAEKELLIDPDFFNLLKNRRPEISHVQVELKGGRHHNEVTQYQYDVILYIGGDVEQPVDYRELDWRKEVTTLAELERILKLGQPGLLRVKQVPNARVIDHVKAAELLDSDEGPDTIGQMRELLRNMPDGGGVDPEDIRDLSRKLSYHVGIDWWGTGLDGSYNVTFKQFTQRNNSFKGFIPPATETDLSRPWNSFSNDPLQGKFAVKLAPELRNFLKANLPEHMVPSAFIFVENLPRTQTGKIQRGALRRIPMQHQELGADYEAPQTDTENMIAEIWQSLLRVDRVGRNDNFFSLGGHSILATQLINRLAKITSLSVPLRCLFEAPTIAEFASHVESIRRDIESADERISQIIEQVKRLSDDEARALLETNGELHLPVQGI